MSGPQSFQRRIDDLYLLKTRNLVFENVNGTFPLKGAIAYTTNEVGAVGFSTVTADTSGNLTVPGTTTMGANGGYVIVDGETGVLTANQDVDIYGKLSVYNSLQTNAINLVNTNDSTVISQLDDRTIDGVETLTWLNAAGMSEPISGWSEKLAPSTDIYRTVDITGLTGATLIMAQNQNALLTLFQQRGVFVKTLTANPALATVFNTSLSITFVITLISSGESNRFEYSVSGSSASAVPYTTIVEDINSAAAFSVFAPPNFASYSSTGTTGTLTFTVFPLYRLQFVDTTSNGTAQMFLNHIGASLQTNVSYLTNTASTIVRDFAVVMPSTPTVAPTVVGTPELTSCTINIPTLPLTTPIAIRDIGIYWCLSGSEFSSSPNAIIPTSQKIYTINGLLENQMYNVALSYRSLYDESPLGPILPFTTKSLNSSVVVQQNINFYSVEMTEDVNWLSTPSYGVAAVNYDKQYMSNVRFTVATVFSAIWSNTLEDLTNISQIQSVVIDIYAGASPTTTGVQFFAGPNMLYTSSEAIEAKYGDAVGFGGSITIDKEDLLRKIFSSDASGNIDISKNMVFGWYSIQGGLRNCEMTRFNVIYSV